MRLIALFICLFPAFGPAASLFTETFDEDMAGWGNAGEGPAWHFANGDVQLVFPEQLFPTPDEPVPALAAGSLASGGAFVGNYRAVGAGIIGFDFFADTGNPGRLALELVSGTNMFFRDLKPRLGTPGITNRIAVSLSSRTAGGWTSLAHPGNVRFEGVLTNVTAVFIRITRGPSGSHAFRIDNVFLDALPSAMEIEAEQAGVALTWTGVRDQWSYRMEATDDLRAASGWEIVSFAVSTNQTLTLWDTGATNSPGRAYRLMME